MTKNPPLEEQRKGGIRRGLTNIVSRDGEVQESKLLAVVFKLAALWLLLAFPEVVLKDWTILMVLIAAGIAPDLLKKVITMKAGGVK